MEIVILVIAVVALAIAIIAFQRTGGIKDLRRQVDALSSKTETVTETMRDRTADVLDRFERLIRGREKQGESEKEGEGGGSSKSE